ncbi:hypothetical protein EUGRSUZ_F04249 [Eucalyptus grandis]|uniref:Uncharacterized protein n=2 Tax=Eucalyptus grandis TaxID=71139 RepID=A0A059BY39_EUCGR|nr:hypothetical protein EUGRSUZ_F04249 [Eucalyptus grandis]
MKMLTRQPLGYICNLKDNVDSLKSATEDLKAARDDVKARVEHEEEAARALRTKQVENWLGKVQEFGGRADEVLREAREHDQIKCLYRCLPPNGWSSYKLGKRVNQMLNEVRELQSKEGEFHVVTSPLPPPQVLKRPMENTVGLDISLTIVWKWLVDEKQVGVIGLYGTGDERVDHLWEVLARKKFVLLIDDVWVRLDLSKIGVPCHNGSKVVFTTRLKQVCHLMQADKTLAVQCLTSEEALKLFEKNVSKSLVDCHPEIQDLAKDIVTECKGLPLALVTVGRAMAGKDDPIEWRHALKSLRNKPHKLPGMEEEVYHILKFSYDSLNDATLQACFLYCCLFPEDYPILVNELIELWIGEGLLGDIDDAYHMRDKGASVLGDLKRACLLESEIDGQLHVKMHDVIRDMATWITRDYGQMENKLLVTEKEEDMFTEMIFKWGEVEKACLWGEWIVNISQTPTINIELFPEGICDLINLQYLNLSNTCVRELPREIKNLTRLRWLLLNCTSETFLIPTGQLQTYQKEEEIMEELGCMQDLTDLSIHVLKPSSALKIFQSFRRCIKRMHITGCKDLTCIPISRSLKESGNFLHLEVLYLCDCPMLVKMEITQGIGRAPNFCFPSLVEVGCSRCGFLDLSWLVHAPKLQSLMVGHCNSMEKIIGDEIARRN